uniref:Uncharacterized protein n=1 Tax=Glossina palpalis gambiensis TaxID=67801 RepID=A0A1B0AZB1_9MUSC
MLHTNALYLSMFSAYLVRQRLNFGRIKSTNSAWNEKSTQHGIYCMRNVKQKIYTLTLATKSQMV